MARVLVFGGHGWVGRALVEALRAAGHEVVAPRRMACDVADSRSVDRVFAETKPDAVVNAAAPSSHTPDEALLVRVNVGGARNVAGAAARTGARLVHVSTDLVLDGRSPPYEDDAPATPVNPYGRSKAGGEAAVADACPAAVIVRASHVFDAEEPDPTLRGFMDRLAKGDPVRLFVDEIRCPIARPILAAALAELVASDVAGTLNVAGTEPLSRFDYGVLLLERFDAPNRGNVERSSARDLRTPRPLDLTLDVSKARSLLRTRLVGVRDALAARRRRIARAATPSAKAKPPVAGASKRGTGAGKSAADAKKAKARKRRKR
jgi:dTDP-4-dehydrorhamnose reductase